MMTKDRRPAYNEKYLDQLEMHIARHDLINETKTISNQLTKASDLTDAIKIQLDNIDNLCIQGMLQVEQKCHKLHTQPYGWTPPITHLIQIIKYWQYLERRAQGKPYHARTLLQF